MRYLVLSLVLIPTFLDAPKLQPRQGNVIFGTPVIHHAEMAARQEKCLATMVYGEARGESRKGQIAVAYTALNRAKNQSVCDVILAPKQYSIFNNNPALRQAALSLEIEPEHKNYVDSKAWPIAMEVAKAVLHRKVPDPTKGSTHYLAPVAMEALGYKYPKWAEQYELTVEIDGHKFYKYAPPKKETEAL